ncbi:MAG: hypothetical protein NTX07_00115, partial [Solirubrobacterales bacterium]|nr:hypothetical protein [Solirubrobacterales bacterium]
MPIRQPASTVNTSARNARVFLKPLLNGVSDRARGTPALIQSPQPIWTVSTRPSPPAALQETAIRTWAASAADPKRVEGRTTGGQVESSGYDAFG